MAYRDEILKYIENEKDISKYRISIIERRSSISPSKRRILEIEREFLSLPLESMSFEDVADAAAAISIYRDSRGLFYKTYGLERPKVTYQSKTELNISVNNRIEFVKETVRDLALKRVQEVNLVQNSDLYEELVKIESAKNNSSVEIERARMNEMDLKALLELEPIAIAKKRARIQTVLCSIGIYLSQALNRIIYSQDNIESLRYAILELDKIIYQIKDNIFQNYNMAINFLKDQDLGMGENPYSGKIHTLQNILDFESNEKAQYPRLFKSVGSFNSHVPQIGNIHFGIKSPIYSTLDEDKERQTKNKVYGIIFPIPRKGSEKMTLLYKNIELDGKNIDVLFCDSLSNVKAKNQNKELEYFKALLVKPLWEIIDITREDEDINKIISKVTRVRNIKNANLNDKSLIKAINSTVSTFIQIDTKSRILVAKTRSEEDGISDILPLINQKVNEIIEDYELSFSTTNDIYLN